MDGNGAVEKKGIYYGWVITGVMFLTTVFIMGSVNYGFATLIKPLKAEFGWSVMAISGAMSIRGIIQALVSPIVGTLADKYGPKIVLIAGSIMMGLGMILFSRVNTLMTFYAAFVLIALGMSCADVTTTMTALANWFRKKIGLASGIMYSGMGASGFLVPLIVVLMNNVGWRNAMMIIGIFLIVVIGPLCLLIRRRPEDYGWAVDGEPLNTSESGSNVAGPKKGDVQADVSLKDALKSRAFWLISLIVVCSALFISAVSTHIIQFGSSIGLTAVAAALTSTVLTSVSIGGRFFIGWSSDKIEVRKTVMGAYFLIFISMLFAVYAAGGNMSVIWIFIPIFAFGYGGISVLRAQLIRSYFGRNNYGKILGFVQAIGTLGVVIGPVFAGRVFDVTGSYRIVWVVYAILACVPILFALIMPAAPFADKKIGAKKSAAA